MKNIKLIILAGIVVLAFLFRFLIAGTDVVYPDSCLYLSYAKSIASGKFTFNFLEGREVILPMMYPLLTALFSFLVNGVELSGILVSSIAGALLIVPVFYITRTVFNEKAAWVSVVLVFISPVLIHWSGAMLTESIFITAFISAIAIGLYSIGNGRRAYLGLCGAMVGLAYMSRVVGLILIPIIGLWIIYHVMSTGKLGDYGKIVKNIIISGVIFILGFVIITAPYLVHIRSHYGNWSLAGGYGSISGMVANEGASNAKDWEVLGSKKTVEESFAAKFIRKMSTNLGDYSSALWKMLYFTAFFAVLGIFVRWKVMYVVSFIMIYFIAFLTMPSTPMLDERIRYLSPVFPLFLVMASGGIARINDRVKWKGIHQAVIPVAVIVVLLSSVYQYAMFPVNLNNILNKKKNIDIREKVGVWIKKNLPEPVRVMSRKPFIAYYADAKWFGTPSTYPEVLELARSKHVDYIVIDRGIDYYLRPELRFLFDPNKIPPELKYMGGVKHPETGEMFIGLYRIAK